MWAKASKPKPKKKGKAEEVDDKKETPEELKMAVAYEIYSPGLGWTDEVRVVVCPFCVC